MGGLGGGRTLDQVGVGVVAINPIPALSEDLGVGVEGFDVFARDGGHEAVVDAGEDLGADVEGGIDEEIEGAGDGSFGGVFDGNDAVVGVAAGDAVEDFGEIWLGIVFDAVAEFADGGLVGPGAFGAEVGDLEIILEGEGGGHDLAVDGADGFFREAALALFDEFFEEGVFALGSVDLEAFLFLDFADFVDGVGALGEEVKKLGVDRVDRFANVVEWHEIDI